MSTWFTQNLIYGYQTTTDVFEQLTKDVTDEEYDMLWAENNANGVGWIVDDDNQTAILGRIVLRGEDWGNDTVFAAESGMIELPQLSPQDADLTRTQIYARIPHRVQENEIKYYIVGSYS